MTDYTITLEADEYDQRSGQAWLLAKSAATGREFRHLIYTSKVFDVLDIREALLATGWIRLRGEELILTGDVLHERVAEVVQEMLHYFEAPNLPRRPLIEVKEAVAERADTQESSVEIPWYAYAWLDVMVREDLADEARSVENVWANRRLDVDCEHCCQRRVGELLARYSQPAARTVSRMASSVPTRAPNSSGDAKTG